MDIHPLAITLVPAHRRTHDDQCIGSNIIPDTPWAMAFRLCLELEFQAIDDCGEEEETAGCKGR